jgi:hypothetical protein
MPVDENMKKTINKIEIEYDVFCLAARDEQMIARKRYNSGQKNLTRATT